MGIRSIICALTVSGFCAALYCEEKPFPPRPAGVTRSGTGKLVKHVEPKEAMAADSALSRRLYIDSLAVILEGPESINFLENLTTEEKKILRNAYFVIHPERDPGTPTASQDAQGQEKP
jgi:hypothetical protein